MRIYLHIGPEEASAARIQSVLSDKREQLLGKGVLYARSPGNKNHTRLFMAATDTGHVDPLRFNRGYITDEKQTVLRDAVVADLAREVEQHKPDTLIVSCTQLGNSLRAPSPADQALFQNGRVHEFTRTLKTGGTRFALEEVMVPDHICPDPDEDLPADFVELLSALDLPVARIDDRLHAEETSMGDSVALAVDRHTPLLCLTRVAYAADGTALAKQVLRMAGAAAYGVTSGG